MRFPRAKMVVLAGEPARMFGSHVKSSCVCNIGQASVPQLTT
jgi:hypothetical protein